MHSLPFDIELRRAQLLTRRSLLGSSTVSLGAFALGNLLKSEKVAAAVEETAVYQTERHAEVFIDISQFFRF